MADRVQKATSAAEFVPSGRLSLAKLRKAAADCRGCELWLEGEVAVIGPGVIVAMGATAAQSLLGSRFKITKERGRFFDGTGWAPATVTATVHPSSILRVPGGAARHAAFEALVADLRKVHAQLAS
ncbi:MAG TPA: uracil-DNA glycosylase family protein [Planctomycetota bacterium]|nr:uracil-DNA glycosylase family protein [Planctomycetota bacterium]